LWRVLAQATGVGWNASMAVFQDIDGNVFHILQSTVMTEQLESKRRAQALREQQ